MMTIGKTVQVEIASVIARGLESPGVTRCLNAKPLANGLATNQSHSMAKTYANGKPTHASTRTPTLRAPCWRATL